MNKKEIIELIEKAYSDAADNHENLSAFYQAYAEAAMLAFKLGPEDAFDIGVHAGILWKSLEQQIIIVANKKRDGRSKGNNRHR